jgi:uncharacterized SAM-binding protein YcdF (DUF218 family)
MSRDSGLAEGLQRRPRSQPCRAPCDRDAAAIYFIPAPVDRHGNVRCALKECGDAAVFPLRYRTRKYPGTDVPERYVTPIKLILFVLLVLFFAAFLLIRRARLAIALTAVAVFWLLAAGWLTAPLLASTQTIAAGHEDLPPSAFAARTAIVLLGGGTEYAKNGQLIPKRDVVFRIIASADLYARCKRTATVCDVIVSGGNPQHHDAAEADTYLPWLLREHVPREDIILENRSLTTYQNARNVAAILPHGYYGSLILVTSAYQMPRALLDFHRFGMAPVPVVSNARHARRGVLPRYENLVSAEIALHELIGLAQFHVYRAIGWF